MRRITSHQPEAKYPNGATSRRHSCGLGMNARPVSTVMRSTSDRAGTVNQLVDDLAVLEEACSGSAQIAHGPAR